MSSSIGVHVSATWLVAITAANLLASAPAYAVQQVAGIGAAPLTLVQPAAPARTRPDLLFREEWRLPQHEGPPTNENRRVTPEVVTNPRVELTVYGLDAKAVMAWEHDGRVDLWTGMAASPIAMTVRDRHNYMDLTGLARIRWIVRTESLHVIYPVVKLADGTLLAGNRAITTDGDFLQVELALSGFGRIRWYLLDPERVVTTTEFRDPDLSKVDEVGFVNLAPGGGHGRAGWANLSTVEVYARPVPR
ncbi:MAG: hypothetical protein H0X67_24090 [Acidobacteria bacterium]|nr:hypothetical protein [Acidobacteriota bacterium]